MANASRTYTIRDLSDEFDITLRALRFYEQRGLLKPDRFGLDRVYSEQDRERIPSTGRCVARSSNRR